jgi:hypothetical protein
VGWSLVLPVGISLSGAAIVLGDASGRGKHIWQARLFQATSAAHVGPPTFATSLERPHRLSTRGQTLGKFAVLTVTDTGTAWMLT